MPKKFTVSSVNHYMSLSTVLNIFWFLARMVGKQKAIKDIVVINASINGTMPIL